jgi:hypothetical protein
MTATMTEAKSNGKWTHLAHRTLTVQHLLPVLGLKFTEILSQKTTLVHKSKLFFFGSNEI